jgi:hypothetical protein
VDHLRTGIPELVVILIVVVLLLFGRRARPKPPGIHPIPANDGLLLNRRRARSVSTQISRRPTKETAPQLSNASVYHGDGTEVAMAFLMNADKDRRLDRRDADSPLRFGGNSSSSQW